MSHESVKKTIGVALGVCLVCSVLVSTAAVLLKDIQKENRKQEKLKNILIAGDLYTEGSNIQAIFSDRIRPEIIVLKAGETISRDDYDDVLNIENFDIKTISRDPRMSRPIPGDQDKAQIRRVPDYMIVYKVKEKDRMTKLILPVYGNGLWDRMYGFIALDRDLRTIKGFTFYEHSETPGLGGEVDNPRWKKLWVGKQAYDIEGRVKISVIKGAVDPAGPEATYQVDGLSGSTLTTRGVHNLVRFWLGDQGYGPYIQRLRAQGLDS